MASTVPLPPASESPPESHPSLDAEWDAFLRSNPRGQFQQSGAWAKVKALDGWSVNHVRVRPLGGAQILWKRSRLGRIGYVSKGPVLADESPEAIDTVLGELMRAAVSLRLRAIIVQPPDESRISEVDFSRVGTGGYVVPGVIRATAQIDVSGGRPAFLAAMGRQTRREARQAAARGVTVDLGTRDDLSAFFKLMQETCRRQKTHPNPGRVELLEALWDAFTPGIFLGLARIGGAPVAGLLMVGFGQRLTFWKKGWDAQDSRSYANTCLNVEALGWACDRGYQEVDFGGMDASIAESLLAGCGLSEEQKRSRDMFNLRLGARPKLLPEARLLILHPVLRAVFKFVCRSEKLRAWVLRRVGA